MVRKYWLLGSTIVFLAIIVASSLCCSKFLSSNHLLKSFLSNQEIVIPRETVVRSPEYNASRAVQQTARANTTCEKSAPCVKQKPTREKALKFALVKALFFR